MESASAGGSRWSARIDDQSGASEERFEAVQLSSGREEISDSETCCEFAIQEAQGGFIAESIGRVISALESRADFGKAETGGDFG